jgi:hypothetical protein
MTQRRYGPQMTQRRYGPQMTQRRYGPQMTQMDAEGIFSLRHQRHLRMKDYGW